MSQPLPCLPSSREAVEELRDIRAQMVSDVFGPPTIREQNFGCKKSFVRKLSCWLLNGRVVGCRIEAVNDSGILLMTLNFRNGDQRSVPIKFGNADPDHVLSCCFDQILFLSERDKKK